MSNDIFKILNHIESGRKDTYSSVEKEYNPYMTLKWLSGVKNPKSIVLLNDSLNLVTFQLSREKKLLYYLSVATSCNNAGTRYTWINRKKKTSSILLEVVTQYYGITDKEAEMSLCNLSKDEIIAMATELGYTEKQIKKIK